MQKLNPTTSPNNFNVYGLSGALVGSILFHLLVLCIPISVANYSNTGVQPFNIRLSQPNLVSSEQVNLASDLPDLKTVTSSEINSKPSTEPPQVVSVIKTPAKLVKLAELELPNALLSSSGMVIMDVVISEKGQVESFSILHSSPDGLFDDYIQAALLKSEIKPAYLGDKPVKQNMILEIQISGGTLGIGSK